MIAFFIASCFFSVSLPSKASLISLANEGLALSKWTSKVQDFSMAAIRYDCGTTKWWWILEWLPIPVVLRIDQPQIPKTTLSLTESWRDRGEFLHRSKTCLTCLHWLQTKRGQQCKQDGKLKYCTVFHFNFNQNSHIRSSYKHMYSLMYEENSSNLKYYNMILFCNVIFESSFSC